MQHKHNNDRGFSAIEGLLTLLIVGVLSLIAWYVYHNLQSDNTQPLASNSSTSSSSSLAPPAIPFSGAYLGAYVDPGTSSGRKGTIPETTLLPTFNQSLGRQLNLVMLYTAWKDPAPIANIDTISSNGGIPMISWGCQDSDINVANGQDDSLIKAYAQALKSYAKPVFLRWFWEMNYLSSQGGRATQTRAITCISTSGPSGYVAAWQHIYNLFRQVGATNVAFVWCPGLNGKGDPASYYPGDNYVNWIAIDGYDRQHQGSTAFSSLFTSFYNEWSNHHKPLMIGETGAMTVDQALYLAGMQSSLPTKFPDIKAIDYFDAVGPAGNWTLQGSGLSQFSQMIKSSYFTVNQ